ncbi:phage antirepressor KilAC domain-containing protein [Phytomonospora sp. NPDC050363]|uniref:phage antirepressor KilAC domain-containing protein n=1 Tax=Phytomonospora sp. NPDC050363 TaxID=3155642 RepID=UPI0033CA3469
MSTDLVLVESASLRREHMDRTDVLDKVKVLQYLPDGLHVDRGGVATYFEVAEATIRKLAQRHADELETNGMYTVAGQEFRDILSPNPSGGRPSAQLFTKRAILNVGMLLRDSDVARRVRSYLLDAEDKNLSRKELALYWYQAEERAELAEAKVLELEPAADSWNVLASIEGDLSVKDAADILSRDVDIEIGRDRLFAKLGEMRWTHRNRGDKRWRPYHYAVKSGWLSALPKDRPDHRNGGSKLAAPQVRVTLKGVAELRRRLSGSANPPIQDDLFGGEAA